MRITDIEGHDRPRERLLAEGCAALSGPELLAILLGSGAPGESAVELAVRLLHLRGVDGVSRMTPGELMRVRGVGAAKACRIAAAFELHRRNARAHAPRRISCEEDAIKHCTSLIGHLDQEHFLVLFLDVKYQVLGHEVIGKGLVDNVLLHPREVFRGAIREGASAIIAAHNHPSGDDTPSEEDAAVTRALAAAGEIVGVPLLDHIVVTRYGGRSVLPTPHVPISCTSRLPP